MPSVRPERIWLSHTPMRCDGIRSHPPLRPEAGDTQCNEDEQKAGRRRRLCRLWVSLLAYSILARDWQDMLRCHEHADRSLIHRHPDRETDVASWRPDA